jgi:RimJ/RimL family protein N-acetyltransferase
VTEIPELRTERLLLRAFRFEDHSRWAEIMRDERIGAGLGKPSGLTPHEAWVDMSVLMGHWLLRGYGHWALEELESGELVGRVGLYYPPDWPGLEVGWTVARDHWGKGYAPEAGREACRWAHAELGADHIHSLIHPGNENSIRVAEKLGETLQGHHQTRGFDLLVYGCDLPLRPAGTGGA